MMQVVIVVLLFVLMLGVGLIVDVLNFVNEIDGWFLYCWQVCLWDGWLVLFVGGVQWYVDVVFNDVIVCDWLIVVFEWFQQFVDYWLFFVSFVWVGQCMLVVIGIYYGVWWFVMVGQFFGYCVSVNWEMYQQFVEQFEWLIVMQQIFEIDCDWVICVGGQVIVDFMLVMIGWEYGVDFVEWIVDVFGVGMLCSGEEWQWIFFVIVLGEWYFWLNDVLFLMEVNVEDLFIIDEIVGLVGVLWWQLEWFF